MILTMNSTTYYHQEKSELYHACQKTVDFSRSYAKILVMASVAVILVGKNEWQMKERGKDETD